MLVSIDGSSRTFLKMVTLSQLLKKITLFIFSNDQMVVFEELKKILVTVPIIVYLIGRNHLSLCAMQVTIMHERFCDNEKTKSCIVFTMQV